MWQRGDGPVVDLGDTAGELAGAVVKLCSLNLELSAACRMQRVKQGARGLKELEASPLCHFAV